VHGPRSIPRPAVAAWLLAIVLAPGASRAESLEDTLGRNETRVLSAPVPIVSGPTVAALALDERLERLGYRRVHTRPREPGEYFHGRDTYWFFRRACRAAGADHEAELIGLVLEPPDGRILGRRRDGRAPEPIRDEGAVWLEPAVLAESLAGDRAERVRIELSALPERVWRPVLAAEDARFFSHGGVDPRAMARAALRDLLKGRIVEGGSTITQQLVKNRDLSPKKSLGRKASETVRALALEEEYDKEEILQAYLNTVYMGHVKGLAIHGFGTAARAYFSRPAAELSLAEAAALAAMIQGPNRLSPLEDAAALRGRRDWVLARMEELGWATADEVARAKATAVTTRLSPPRGRAPVHLLSWVREEVARAARAKDEEGPGFLVETTVDPYLQELAERAVERRLADLRRGHGRLKGSSLTAAVVALDARTGAVLAAVGGNPDDPPGSFDRVRAAKRQPGSVVKPFVALEAIDDCGSRDPLTASSRILDEPLSIALPTGRWEPHNFDERYLGPVLLREALAESRNVPAVRIARWCGFDATAARFARVGLELPPRPPPAFVLGAVETTPIAVARAFTVFATPGRVLEPFPVWRAATPGGRALERWRPRSTKVADPAAAYIVRDLLRTAVEEGTAVGGAIAGVDVAAKTGSSSDLRDAWFAGQAGSVVAVVWVGLDDGGRLGLTGAAAAGPLWRELMARAVPARPPYAVERADGVVERWVQEKTGLLVRAGRSGARPELYRKGDQPRRKRWWRPDAPTPVIE
jgi:penicillin-binding protein 1B